MRLVLSLYTKYETLCHSFRMHFAANVTSNKFDAFTHHRVTSQICRSCNILRIELVIRIRIRRCGKISNDTLTTRVQMVQYLEKIVLYGYI